jgi:hypothetical protein
MTITVSGSTLTFSDSTTQTTAATAAAMTLIGTYSLSGSSYAVTGLSGYTSYMIIISNLVNNTGTSNDALCVQHGYGATPTYVTSGWATSSYYSNNNVNLFPAGAQILYIFSTGGGMYTVGGQALIEGSGTGVLSAQGLNYGGNGYTVMSGGQLATANSTITALKFFSAQGYSYTGTLKLYGIT